MSEEEKQEYREELVEQIKKYCRIDYDDDEDIILIMVEAAFEKLRELIKGFDPYAMTNRQRMLVMTHVKDQYDNKEVYVGSGKTYSPAFSSMLLSEIYKGGSV